MLCEDTESINKNTSSRELILEDKLENTTGSSTAYILVCLLQTELLRNMLDRATYVNELAVLVSIAAGAAMIAKYNVSALTERYCGVSHYKYMSNPTRSSVELVSYHQSDDISYFSKLKRKKSKTKERKCSIKQKKE